MTLNLLVGGMPRGGTTVAAKFLSLHQNIFCYAGETHLIPFMHSMFGRLPCREDRIDLVVQFLRQQFMTAMVEMPRFSVSQGAHPGNLIFEEENVDELVERVRDDLKAQLFGADAYTAALTTLHAVLSKVNRSLILGEKTPNNIFAMADFAGVSTTKSIVVMREPIGVIRSMKTRVAGGDKYADAFKGDIEANIGMYLEYASAARQVLNSEAGGLLVRYEDIAQIPATVVKEMFQLFGNQQVEERVIKFVEHGQDREIADRAPMNYKRLNVSPNTADLSSVDIWKVFSLTRELRGLFGYSDAEMTEFGFDVSTDWPDVSVPATVLPLFGFHSPDWVGGRWMKRKGSLVVYLGKGKTHSVMLNLESNFPDQIESDVDLTVYVNEIRRGEVFKVGTGNQLTTVHLKIDSDELVPMGNKGGYVVLNLESSIAYSQIGHTDRGNDGREISFKLKNWKIDKNRFKWW